MQKTESLRAVSFSKQLALTAVFAALCFVGTFVIVLPLPNGYFNVGDVFVLLAGWCLGPLYGSVAAGLGSALADIVSGFAIYVPATFLIKALDALVAYLVWAFLKKFFLSERLDFLPRLFSAIVGESIMLGGYFLFESLLYGVAGAIPAVVGNLFQGGICTAVAVLLLSVLYPVKEIHALFPMLD